MSGAITTAFVGCLLLCQQAAAVVTASDQITVAERQVPLRILYSPESPVHGVIVLSHGTFSSGKKYDAVARPWAAAGFAVILPDHRDANFGDVPRGVDDMLRIVASRVAEVRAIATAMPDIARRLGEPADDWAALPLVAAGHSIGTQIAMQVTGLRIRNPQDGSVSGYPENRFAATVLLSDPGKMAAMPANVWEAGSQPVFMVTGPEDFGLMGDGRRDLGFENEVLMPEIAGDLYRVLLSIDGLDHQFGGLVHKDVDGPPDNDALALFLSQSLRFLQRCVAQDAAAEAPSPGRLSERAVVSVTAAPSAAHGC